MLSLIFCSLDDAVFTRYYRSKETVKAAIFEDLEIALEPVFAKA